MQIEKETKISNFEKKITIPFYSVSFAEIKETKMEEQQSISIISLYN